MFSIRLNQHSSSASSEWKSGVLDCESKENSALVFTNPSRTTFSTMGSWDEICFICGISPESQRSSLYYFSDADELIKKMVSSILEGKLLDLKEKEVESIVKELLMLCRKSPDKWFDVVDEWVAFQEYKDKYPLTGSYWPPNASYYGDGRNANWEGWNPIAIGTFCDKGFPTHASVGDKVISPGGSVSCKHFECVDFINNFTGSRHTTSGRV